MSATKDLLPFPTHDTLPTSATRSPASSLSVRALARPAQVRSISALAGVRRLPGSSRSGASLAHGAKLRTRGVSRFTKARLARAVELTGSCLLIVTFLAAALFV